MGRSHCAKSPGQLGIFTQRNANEGSCRQRHGHVGALAGEAGPPRAQTSGSPGHHFLTGLDAAADGACSCSILF